MALWVTRAPPDIIPWPLFPVCKVPTTLDAGLEAVKVAHNYEVPQLLASAQDVVLSLTKKDNAVRVWSFAVEHLPFCHGKAIAYRAFSEVRDNLDALAATPEKELNQVDDAGMELLLRSNDLIVRSEDNVKRAVVHRLDGSTDAALYRARAAWMSLVRWGRLAQSNLRCS